MPADRGTATGTTRTLVLMRHANPEGWSATGDMGRRLTADGRQQAADAGALLAPLGITRVLRSPSARTRETAEHLGLAAPVDEVEALYHCGSEGLAEIIAATDDEVTGLLVVAHAPAVPNLAAELANRAAPGEGDEVAGWFPPATFTVFTLEGPWAVILDGPAPRFVAVQRFEA